MPDDELLPASDPSWPSWPDDYGLVVSDPTEDESVADPPEGHELDGFGPVDIDELYEPRIMALIEGGAVGNEPGPRMRRTRPVVRKSPLGGAILAGAMIGLGEVFEPEKAKTAVIEFAPDRLDENEQPVTFLMAPGNPRASRLIIRPWLRDRLRR